MSNKKQGKNGGESQAQGSLEFILFPTFEKNWQKLNLSAADLIKAEMMIAVLGMSAPVIPGTCGLRKIRFAPPGWATGKSGGARICFFYFPGFVAVVLVTVYRKNQEEDLSPEFKKKMCELQRSLQGFFAERPSKPQKRDSK